MGGIASGEDAAEFMVAGATAVEVGTATFWDPRAPLRIARELAVFLRRERVGAASDLTGTLKL
jgi:dihydroorotate dehydrogenase (NAD+) catalytic subunit